MWYRSISSKHVLPLHLYNIINHVLYDFGGEQSAHKLNASLDTLQDLRPCSEFLKK